MSDGRDGVEYLKQVALVPVNENHQLVDPHAVHTTDPGYLVKLAKEVSYANNAIKAGACGKLEIIAKQIRYLQEQARQVLLDAAEDELITKASCNFIKKPGQTYHLYKKEDGKSFMGMLSPDEWGGSPPHQYVGSYKLEYDMTFTPLQKVKSREEEMSRVSELYAERHIVPNHLPGSSFSRHGNRGSGDPRDWINCPRLEPATKTNTPCPSTSESSPGPSSQSS